MTNHVNKGAQKSSVNQFGHDPNSAHEKSAKMEHFHKVHQEKEKKRVNELIHKNRRTVYVLCVSSSSIKSILDIPIKSFLS